MDKWTKAAIKRKETIAANELKAADMDVLITEIMKLPLVKKVLPDSIVEVLKKYGYTE
jgi:hypothetical protein